MKFKLLLAALSAGSLAFAAPAQTPESFSPHAFEAHVSFLADDLLKGRLPGTPGYDIAARYVATRLAAAGAQPAAGSGWMQNVELLRYVSTGSARLSLGGREFLHGRDILVRASPEVEASTIEAPLVFAGYGLHAPALGHDDYAGLDVRGKIVVLLSGTPSDLPSDVAAHLDSEKSRTAADQGAVGMITIRLPSEEDARPWERMTAFGNRPGTTWIGPNGIPFNRARIFSLVANRETAAALFARSGRNLDELLAEAARDGGKPAGFDLRQTARLERPGARHERITSANVVGVLPGTDPELADEYVLLMAHLDGLGEREAREGDASGEDRIRNGAMDNATGVATLIEVARHLALPGNRPRRPVMIAAVTAEEMGLLGAQYLARHPAVPGKVVAVVNLDMPILTYDFQDVIAFGAEHSTMGPIVERAARRMNVSLTPDPLPEEGLFTRSDHYRFVQEGVPSVFLMTGFGGEGREKFTGFLRGEYHSPKDDLALPFNCQAGARFAQLNHLSAHEIEDADQAPLWYSDSVFAVGPLRAERSAGRTAPEAQATSR